jgi:hypothetical protein
MPTITPPATKPLDDAAPHTCWDDPTWDGLLRDSCAGCDQAVAHPCQWCGYGHAFTTHSDVAHAENGDTNVPAEPTDAWHNSPHVAI